MKRLAFVSIIAGYFAIGCSGNSKVSIVGKSHEEQSQEIADKFCEKSVKCGRIEISCTGLGDEFACTGTIGPEDYQECYDEFEPSIRASLERCELTEAEERQLEDCLNIMLGQKCVSQSELDGYLDAYVDAINTGSEEPEWPRPFPVECEILDELFDC